MVIKVFKDFYLDLLGVMLFDIFKSFKSKESRNTPT